MVHHVVVSQPHTCTLPTHCPPPSPPPLQAILRRKGQLAEQMSDAGVLEAREAIELGRLLEGRQAHLARHPPRPEVADSLSLLRCHHLLQGLQPGQVEELARGAEVMVVPAGTVALRAGEGRAGPGLGTACVEVRGSHLACVLVCAAICSSATPCPCVLRAGQCCCMPA